MDSCDGVDFDQYRYFDIIAFTVSIHLDVPLNQEVPPNDTIRFDELDEIFINYEAEYHAFRPQNNWSFSLMPMANACTVIPGTGGSKTERLINFSITTINDFDADHLADSNINDLFDYHGSWRNNYAPIPLSQFLDEQTGNLQEEDMVLELKKAPELNSEFQIKVVMELSTGEVYDFETEPIFITP